MDTVEKVGIVVCNYNKQADVINCITSILENKFEDYFIYVVDNASTDASVSEIERNFSDVSKLMLIVNEENLGGSGGFNTGLRVAYERGHEFLMCVDNDAMLDENCIMELLRHMEKDPETGIAAAKIYHAGMEDYVQHYGSFIGWDKFDVNSIFLNHFEDGTMPETVYSDAVPACAMLIRREVIDKIGFLPEENFLYWDDTEFCVRATMAGYQIASVGKAMAVHAMGAKKEDVNTFPTYYGWRNWVKFYVDHVPNAMLEDMADTFLSSLFEICYSCQYRNEPSRLKTVMAAFDDALHGVMGKAGPERIFDLEKTYKGIEETVKDKDEIVLVAEGYPLFMDSLKDRLTAAFPDKKITIVLHREGLCNTDTKAVLVACESIFWQEDLSFEVYWIDLDENVLRTEEDALLVINYPFAKRAFLFAHKPEFLRLAKELRA